MATVSDPRFRALDSSGNAYVGATLTVYTAGTTTPASIFRDSGLTTPMTNPTTGSDKSGADGYFPQVFAAEGQTFDVVVKNSSGTTLWSLVSVPSLGQESGAFLRDLTGSRIQISNSAGTVEIETGNATGDDTGGTARVGGWAGTQGDSLSLDYAAVNTTGTFTENSKSLPGVVVASGSFSAVTTVDIPLTNDPTGVHSWQVELADLFCSNNIPVLSFRFSFDNGATFSTSAAYNGYYTLTSGASVATTSISGATAIGFSWTTLNGFGNVPVSAQIVISTPNSAGSQATTLTGHMWSASGANTISTWHDASAGRATHVRLMIGSGGAGTLTGKYRVIPRRGLN